MNAPLGIANNGSKTKHLFLDLGNKILVSLYMRREIQGLQKCKTRIRNKFSTDLQLGIKNTIWYVYVDESEF